uniref:Uncharacterized protein n=1 Tax=Rhizophora mucronata TaxID=61149 RepID=A0A2P2QHH3_RHIMU
MLLNTLFSFFICSLSWVFQHDTCFQPHLHFYF